MNVGLMAERETFADFSLLGGPLHRLGRRLGLVRGATNTVALGLALAALLWTVLIVLALIDGVSDQAFSLSVIGAHARLLVAIPLFFMCEAWIAPMFAAFVREIVRAEVVPRTALPALQSEIARITRWKDAALPEVICLLAAVLLSLIAPQLHLAGLTTAYDPTHANAMTWTAQWYWVVCMTVFRFLMFRWLWRLFLWCFFLWRLSKLELRLIPTHPDGVAGLGFLEAVHAEFAPLVLAISAVQAASFAEQISAGAMTFEAIYPGFILILLVDAVLFLGPLCIFAPKLWLTRMKGLSDYMTLAAHYVSDFDRKWLGAAPPENEPLLGTADLQSLADLNNSVSIVRSMNLVPVSPRLLLFLAAAALLPMLPLVLFKFPVDVLAQKLFSILFGM